MSASEVESQLLRGVLFRDDSLPHSTERIHARFSRALDGNRTASASATAVGRGRAIAAVTIGWPVCG